jgi:hypothetical protein
VTWFDHGLLFTAVGVEPRLVQDETDEAVGEAGPRFVYHVVSSCKLTMEMVC